MFALLGGIMTSCMSGDWDDPNNAEAFGNNTIEETNVMTIADLKKKYESVTSASYTLEQITNDVQIKGRITGNDIGGNIYNQVAIDDGTGAILICIAQGGLFGYLPVGQEILVSLKDLYIGGYGKQPQIGTPYTNKNGSTYVSRMSRMLWNQHFRLVGQADPTQVAPIEFDKNKVKDEAYRKENCGKLMTIKDVEFADGGDEGFAVSDSESNVNQTLKGISSSNLVVRTSTYADFAAQTLPEGKVNLTGIFTRYNNTWQILLRSEKDIEILD